MLAHRVETFGMTWVVLVLCAELGFFASRVHALHAADAAQAQVDRTRRDELHQLLNIDFEIAAANARLDELRNEIEHARSLASLRAMTLSEPARVRILDDRLVLIRRHPGP